MFNEVWYFTLCQWTLCWDGSATWSSTTLHQSISLTNAVILNSKSFCEIDWGPSLKSKCREHSSNKYWTQNEITCAVVSLEPLVWQLVQKTSVKQKLPWKAAFERFYPLMLYHISETVSATSPRIHSLPATA